MSSPTPVFSSKCKYQALLDDVDVRRWRENVARGSAITADVYFRRLGAFCKSHNTTPKALLSFSEIELYNMVLDLVSSMEKSGHAGSYTESVIKAIRSWLNHNGKDINRRIRVKGAEDAPTLKDERVPSKDELKQIFLSADKKARVAGVLIAHSGVRIEVLGNYYGQDGLRIADLPEIEILPDSVCFKRNPALVVVRKELSKARHQYFTFLSTEGCAYLQDYLEERLRSGEILTPKSAIITPKLKMKPFIRSNNVGDAIKVSIKAAGFNWRPYVLRAYFDTMLMLAESKGLVMRDYRQFWMGHKGDIENRYTTNKQKLPETVIEDMRSAYARSEEFLQTTENAQANEDKLRDEFRKQLLLVSGFSKEEIEKMDMTKITDEELQSILRKKLLGQNQPNNQNQKSENPTQKVIKVEDTNKYLEKGWEYVAKLTENTVIIRKGLDD